VGVLVKNENVLNQAVVFSDKAYTQDNFRLEFIRKIVEFFGCFESKPNGYQNNNNLLFTNNGSSNSN